MLVGRSPSAALRLQEVHVSGEHATLIWAGGHWEVRDLGSRNGTWVDGKRITAGEAVVVENGVTIAFGDPEDPWEMAEAGPPAPLAEDLRSGDLKPAVDGILALPDEEHPEVVVYADTAGRWMLEEGDKGARPVEDEHVVTVAGAPWRIRVPAQHQGTATVNVLVSLDAVKLRFAVSRDEEHVQVTVVHRNNETPLEPREHWYTLLTLARQRLKDGELPGSEQGWIERDDLLKMLGVDSNALNVAIYRARRQLQAAGVDGAAALVEVRRGQRRIGLAVDRLEVVPL